MEPIRVHLFPKDLNNREKFPTAVFKQEFKQEWLDDEFTKYCIDTIDKCPRVYKDWFHSDILGDIKIFDMSGGLKTLLLAYHNPDLRYPLTNLGDNCTDALYESCRNGSTQWYYRGYFPKLRKEQTVYIVDTDELLHGDEVPKWEIFGAPDWANVLCRFAEDGKRYGL